MTDTLVTDTPPALSRLLREARRQRELSLEEIAGHIKFSTRQLAALEAGNWDVFSSRVFLQGAVKTYGRYLGVQEDALLNALEMILPPIEEREIALPYKSARFIPTGAPKNRRSWIVLLVLVGLVIAIAVFFPRVLQQFRAQSGVVLSMPDGEPVVSHLAVDALAVVEQGTSAPEISSAEITHTELVSTDMPASTTGVQPAASRNFELKTSAPAWIEVRDASGKIIVREQFAANTSRVVSGTPPFKLKLGNAAHVSLSFAGQAVDLLPFTKASVAKLTLPISPAVAPE